MEINLTITEALVLSRIMNAFGKKLDGTTDNDKEYYNLALKVINQQYCSDEFMISNNAQKFIENIGYKIASKLCELEVEAVINGTEV